MSSGELYQELLNNQLLNIDSSKKFQITDIKRISKKISNSIFNKKECTIWKCNTRFYFRRHRHCIRRLLYYNYIGDPTTQHITLSCGNCKCVNINHIKIKNDPFEASHYEIKNMMQRYYYKIRNHKIKCICGSNYTHPSGYKRHSNTPRHKGYLKLIENLDTTLYF